MLNCKNNGEQCPVQKKVSVFFQLHQLVWCWTLQHAWIKCWKGNEQFSILRNSLLSTFQKSQQIEHLWISTQIPIWKRKILILNSASGDDKSCVKFTPPVGENVAINLGWNGFPIVNSLRQFLQMINYILRRTHLIWLEFPSQVMNWRETLEFPPEVPISEPATKTILRWAWQ